MGTFIDVQIAQGERDQDKISIMVLVYIDRDGNLEAQLRRDIKDAGMQGACYHVLTVAGPSISTGEENGTGDIAWLSGFLEACPLPFLRWRPRNTTVSSREASMMELGDRAGLQLAMTVFSRCFSEPWTARA